MGPIEEALREEFFPPLFGGEEINANFQQIIGHSVKHCGLGIPDPGFHQRAYNTYKAASGGMVDSILGGSALNYVCHRACVRKASLSARRVKMHVEIGDLARQKELSGGQERNRINRATRNGEWISSVPHRLNSTEFSQEEFRDNLRLRYGLMPQDIPTTCDGCGKRFSINHALSCPKCGLVLERNDDAAKEGVTLGAQALFPIAITYIPKIHSRKVQGGGTRSGARQDGGSDNGGTDTVGESQGGRARTVNRAARSILQPGQVEVNAESRADVSTHGFWKRGTTVMFDIQIFNLDAGSYLRMTPKKKILQSQRRKGRTCKEFYSYFLLCGRNKWSTGLSHTEDVSHTTQLQDEVGILRNVWLCAGEDVTSYNEV